MDLLDAIHKEGATIVMVTHDPELARHAQRNVRLHDGRISEVVAVEMPKVASIPVGAVS